MNRYEIKKSKQIQNIANKLIKTRDDLTDVRLSDVKIAYVTSQEEKKQGNGTRLVLGECKKVHDIYQWICPYDFIITIYEQNCYGMTPEQMRILVWHELKHIGINNDADEESYYVVPHDYEEFASIVSEYGLDWGDVVG